MKRYYASQQGHILLETLIIMPILVAILFLPLNFSIVQHKRSVINNILEKALQQAAVEGGITSEIRQDILLDMQAQGFDRLQAIIEPDFYQEKLRGEIIEITVSVPGNSNSLSGVGVFGSQPPPGTWMITATGSIMSEKIQ